MISSFLLYIFVAIIFFTYSFFETISYEYKLAGYKTNFYPLGISYSNISLSVCRLLALIFMLSIAFVLDLYSSNRFIFNYKIITFLIPFSFLAGIFIYSVFRKKIFYRLTKSIFKKKNKGKINDQNNGNFLNFSYKTTKKKNTNVSMMYKIYLFSMFFFSYIGIPLCVFFASITIDYRASILQLIAFFSGMYAFFNTLFIDPILSKNYKSKYFENLYFFLFRIRVIVSVLVPLIIFLLIFFYE